MNGWQSQQGNMHASRPTSDDGCGRGAQGVTSFNVPLLHPEGAELHFKHVHLLFCSLMQSHLCFQLSLQIYDLDLHEASGKYKKHATHRVHQPNYDFTQEQIFHLPPGFCWAGGAVPLPAQVSSEAGWFPFPAFLSGCWGADVHQSLISQEWPEEQTLNDHLEHLCVCK